MEKEAHCQFVRRADGKLVRLNLRLPMSVRPNQSTAPGHVTPALTPIGQVPHFSGSSWLQLRLEDEDSVRHATELEMEVIST